MKTDVSHHSCFNNKQNEPLYVIYNTLVKDYLLLINPAFVENITQCCSVTLSHDIFHFCCYFMLSILICEVACSILCLFIVN